MLGLTPWLENVILRGIYKGGFKVMSVSLSNRGPNMVLRSDEVEVGVVYQDAEGDYVILTPNDYIVVFCDEENATINCQVLSSLESIDYPLRKLETHEMLTLCNDEGVERLP